MNNTEPTEQFIQLGIWFLSMAGVIMIAALVIIFYNIYDMRDKRKHNDKHI